LNQNRNYSVNWLLWYNRNCNQKSELFIRKKNNNDNKNENQTTTTTSTTITTAASSIKNFENSTILTILSKTTTTPQTTLTTIPNLFSQSSINFESKSNSINEQTTPNNMNDAASQTTIFYWVTSICVAIIFMLFIFVLWIYCSRHYRIVDRQRRSLMRLTANNTNNLNTVNNTATTTTNATSNRNINLNHLRGLDLVDRHHRNQRHHNHQSTRRHSHSQSQRHSATTPSRTPADAAFNYAQHRNINALNARLNQTNHRHNHSVPSATVNLGSTTPFPLHSFGDLNSWRQLDCLQRGGLNALNILQQATHNESQFNDNIDEIDEPPNYYEAILFKKPNLNCSEPPKFSQVIQQQQQQQQQEEEEDESNEGETTTPQEESNNENEDDSLELESELELEISE
jgi:hypothetical protein